MQGTAPGAPALPTSQPRDRDAPPRTDLFTVGAVELARLVREREISPVEIAEAFLSRQADLDPQLHAFCTPTPELTHAAARNLRRRGPKRRCRFLDEIGLYVRRVALATVRRIFALVESMLTRRG